MYNISYNFLIINSVYVYVKLIDILEIFNLCYFCKLWSYDFYLYMLNEYFNYSVLVFMINIFFLLVDKILIIRERMSLIFILLLLKLCWYKFSSFFFFFESFFVVIVLRVLILLEGFILYLIL